MATPFSRASWRRAWAFSPVLDSGSPAVRGPASVIAQVAGCMRRPLHIVQRLLDPRVGVFDEVLARNLRRTKVVDQVDEVAWITALLQVNVGAGQILQLRDGLWRVAKRNQTEIDVAEQPGIAKGVVDLHHRLTCAIDVRVHRQRRIDREHQARPILAVGLATECVLSGELGRPAAWSVRSGAVIFRLRAARSTPAAAGPARCPGRDPHGSGSVPGRSSRGCRVCLAAGSRPPASPRGSRRRASAERYSAV